MKKSISNKIQPSIKEITEHCFYFNESFENEMPGIKNLIPDFSTTRKYYEDGREIEIEHFCKGELEKKEVYKYNEKNQRIEITELNFSSISVNSEHSLKGELEKKKIHRYNEKDQLIETVEIDSSGNPLRKSVCSYYPNGLYKEEIVYRDMENFDFKLFFTYDKDLKLATETFIHHEDEDELITTYEYLDDGRKEVRTARDSSGKTIEKMVTIFDEKGNVVQSKQFDKIGDLRREFLYTYDEFNNCLSKEFWFYDNQEMVKHSREEREYFYDEANNWIKTIFNAEKESSLIIREIVYY